MDRYIIKQALLAVLFALIGINANAVLPENNVDKTVQLLTKELNEINNMLEKEQGSSDIRRQMFWNKITNLEDEIAIARLVLLSQGDDNPLGMAQATQHAHEVIDQVENFQKPIDGWIHNLRDKIKRTKGIRAELASIDTLKLSRQGLAGRNESLILCDSIEAFYAGYLKNVSADIDRYKVFENRIDTLAATNNATIDRLYQCIFVTGNEGIGEAFRNYIAGDTTSLTITTVDPSDAMESEWKTTPDIVSEINNTTSRTSLLLCIVVYFGLAFLKNKQQRKLKLLYRYRGAIALLLLSAVNIIGAILTLMLIDAPVHVYRNIIFDMQFDIMLALIVLVQISRKDGHKLRYTVLIYLPIMLVSQLIIQFIDSVMSVSDISITIAFITPFIILMQAIFNIAFRKKLNISDKMTAWTNFAVLTICMLANDFGWSMLAIMAILAYMTVVIMWLFYYMMRNWFIAKIDIESKPIMKYTLQTAIYPLFVIGALLGSAYWVADIFNLDSWMTKMLGVPFADVPDVCRISVGRLLMILTIGIIVNYCVGLAKRVFLTQGSDRYTLGKKAVAISLCSILAWLVYAILAVIMLDINHTGIIAAIGGASVGLGFALRDTIENFFYGITMMTGRARPGDIVECDGIRGIVRQVGIISTSLDTEDGPMVSLPNRQLFGRNFKNLTVNDSRELRHIIFDIDANNDIDKARRIMLECLEGINGVVPNGGHYVIMRNCGSGVVRMELKACIDTRKYLRTEPAVREAIFHAFNKHGIKHSNVFREIEVRTTDNIMGNSPFYQPTSKK